jgi:hypothetical protein
MPFIPTFGLDGLFTSLAHGINRIMLEICMAGSGRMGLPARTIPKILEVGMLESLNEEG